MNISPFVRNLGILALISLVIMVLNLETSLVTAAILLRIAFFIAIAFVAYMLWRDFGRREIELWPRRAQWVFYGSVAPARDRPRLVLHHAAQRPRRARVLPRRGRVRATPRSARGATSTATADVAWLRLSRPTSGRATRPSHRPLCCGVDRLRVADEEEPGDRRSVTQEDRRPCRAGRTVRPRRVTRKSERVRLVDVRRRAEATRSGDHGAAVLRPDRHTPVRPWECPARHHRVRSAGAWRTPGRV